MGGAEDCECRGEGQICLGKEATRKSSWRETQRREVGHSFIPSLVCSFIHVSSCSFGHYFLRDRNFLTLAQQVTPLHPLLRPLCRPFRGSWICFAQLPTHHEDCVRGEAEKGLKTFKVREPRAGDQPGSPRPFPIAPILVSTSLGTGSSPLPPSQTSLLWHMTDSQ